MTTIVAGSKMDKMVKAFVAMHAISQMAPSGGGLVGDLMDAYQIVYSKFREAHIACGMEEADALSFCCDFIFQSAPPSAPKD